AMGWLGHRFRRCRVGGAGRQRCNMVPAWWRPTRPGCRWGLGVVWPGHWPARRGAGPRARHGVDHGRCSPHHPGGVMHPEPLRIMHITDTHIIAEPGAEVYGVDSFAALESLLAVMQRDPWTPHLLIATGDLSEDGSAVSYQRLRSLLTSVGLPVYCIPGNHDVLAEMHAHLQGGPIHRER